MMKIKIKTISEDLVIFEVPNFTKNSGSFWAKKNHRRNLCTHFLILLLPLLLIPLNEVFVFFHLSLAIAPQEATLFTLLLIVVLFPQLLFILPIMVKERKLIQNRDIILISNRADPFVLDHELMHYKIQKRIRDENFVNIFHEYFDEITLKYVKYFEKK